VHLVLQVRNLKKNIALLKKVCEIDCYFWHMRLCMSSVNL